MLKQVPKYETYKVPKNYAAAVEKIGSLAKAIGFQRDDYQLTYSPKLRSREFYLEAQVIATTLELLAEIGAVDFLIVTEKTFKEDKRTRTTYFTSNYHTHTAVKLLPTQILLLEKKLGPRLGKKKGCKKPFVLLPFWSDNSEKENFFKYASKQAEVNHPQTVISTVRKRNLIPISLALSATTSTLKEDVSTASLTTEKIVVRHRKICRFLQRKFLALSLAFLLSTRPVLFSPYIWDSS